MFTFMGLHETIPRFQGLIDWQINGLPENYNP